jgi:O-antigen/teichoic acid export membrane protein
MSRKKLYIRGVAISYLALGANIAYSLASIPLALHYLGKEQFGLWAVVLQFVGYLHLLDLGISNGLSRIVIDEKDNRSTGAYGSVLLTATIAQSIIGFCVILVGWVIDPWASGWFNIPPELSADFANLIGLQATIAGLGIAFRHVGTPLFAFQRNDLVGIQTIGLFAVYFMTLWAGLKIGLGLYSMVLSMACGLFWTVIVYTIFNIKLGLLPRGKEWGSPSWSRFAGIFSYSRDLFMMSLGWQILSGAPILIISRTFGLDSAAAWSICTKPFQIIFQIVNKPYDLSFSLISEMYVRSELTLLKTRIAQIFQFSSTLSAIAFTSAATLSPLFISIWTDNTIRWPLENYWAVAIMYFVFSIVRIPNGFVGVSKNIRLLKYSYFSEGAIFAAIALWLGDSIAVWAIPLIALTCHLTISSPIGIRYFKRDLMMQSSDFFQMVYPSIICVLVFGCFGYYVSFWQPFVGVINEYNLFMLKLFIMASLGLPILWFFALSSQIKLQLQRAITSILSK